MQLPPFHLERYFARYEFAVPYVLCGSDCESMTIYDLLALEPGAEARLLNQWLGYSESQGNPTLRQSISALYTSIQPDEIIVHSGAEEAIFLCMHAALQPGDHVIVHTPCYQSLTEVARSIGCTVVPWQADPTRGWSLDLDELLYLIQPTTRLIVVNTPHNPTGYLMPRDAFIALHQIADALGIVVFSDEVYRESEYNPDDTLPAACDLSERAVSLGVMSKTYGLPGLRIGWVSTHNQPLAQKILQLKDYTTICNSVPSECLAEIALRHREHLVARNRGIIMQNVELVDTFFACHTDWFAWQRPVAGPMAFPHLERADVETFCHDLATQAGVLLLPGSVYDDHGNHFRIGMGRRNLTEALERVDIFLDDYNS